jgi:hypothetical protein
MNTRFDYEYARQHHLPGWENAWLALLERWTVIDNELVEDQNAPIFRLGFTVDEVAGAVGFSGYTPRQLEWYQGQPDRYELVDGMFSQVAGWAERYAKDQLAEAMEAKLGEIDMAVVAESNQPFLHNGHHYYLDIEYIQGVYSALPLLPDNWSQQWKTADKPDGINNVYVAVDKAGVQALALAALQRKTSVWQRGDDLKKAVKLLTTAEQIAAFAVVL